MREKLKMKIASKRVANILRVLSSFNLIPYDCSYSTLVSGDICYAFYLDVTCFTSVEFDSLLNLEKVDFIGIMPFGFKKLRFTFKVFTNEKKK